MKSGKHCVKRNVENLIINFDENVSISECKHFAKREKEQTKQFRETSNNREMQSVRVYLRSHKIYQCKQQLHAK